MQRSGLTVAAVAVDFAKSLADEVLGDVGVRLGIKAAKARGSFENVSDEPVQVVDVTGAFNVDNEGFRATLLAPSKYADDPELFYGPFLQVGSYFDIGPDWLQFAIDSVVDPLNLVTAGTGGALGKVGIRGLTKAGRQASLMSTLGRVAQARKSTGASVSGADIVDEAMQALEVAGRLTSIGSDELVAAAKAGDKSLKATLRRAADMAPDGETKRLLESLRRDRDVLGEIIDRADDLRGIKQMPGNVFLQETLSGRIAAGQARAPIGIVRPANPVRQPLTFARQIVGFSHGGDDVLFPGSALFSEGLDRAIGKLPGEALPEGVDDIGRTLIEAFRPRVFRRGDVTVGHAAFSVQAMTAMLASPGAPAFAALGHGAIDDAAIDGIWRKLSGLADSTDIDRASPAFVRFNELLERNMTAGRRHADQVNNAARNRSIEDSIAVMHAFGEAHGVDDALLGKYDSTLRVISDMMSADQLRYDAISPGNALAARSSLGKLLAHTSAATMRDVLRRVVPAKKVLGIPVGRGPQDQMAAVIPRLIDHPELWDVSAVTGRATLKADMLDKVLTPDLERSASPMLRKVLNDAGGAESQLARHLVDEGVHPELVEMSNLMKGSLDAIAPNLMSEGVTRQLTENYFTRVFRPGEKFWTQYKGGPTVSGNQFIAKLFDGADDGLLGDLAKAEIGTGDMLKAAREGKATPLQVRRWTEAAAIRAEELKFGKVELDGINAFSNYLSDVNDALLFQRLRRELPHMSPRITRDLIRSYFGDEVADGLSDDVFQYGRVVEGELPSALTSGDNPMFRRVTDRPGTRSDDQEIAQAAVRRALVGTARRDGGELAAQRVAARLDGATEINGFGLVDDAGNPVEFNPAWVTDGIPDDIVGERTVQGWLQHEYKVAEIEQSIVDAVTAEWLSREVKHGSRAVALEAGAKARRVLAAAEARATVARRLNGAKTFNGIAVTDASGNQIPFQAEWALEGRVPKGVTGTVKGRSLTAAGIRRELKSVVDGEALSADMATKVQRKYDALARGAAAAEARAVTQRLLVAAAEEDAIAAVAKSFPKVRFKGRAIIDSVTGKPVHLKPEWIIDPSKLPKTLVARRAIKQAIRQRVRAGVMDRTLKKQTRIERNAIRRAAQFMPLDDIGPPKPGDLWVFSPDFHRLQDVFRVYSQEGVTSKWMRLYDRLNHAFKGVVLGGDIFHYNVLATSQFAALSTLNPRAMLDSFRDETGELLPGVARAAFRSAVGGAAGAVVGSGLGEDDGDIATFSLAGAIYGALVGGATANARHARNLALNPEHLDSLRWMGIGGWTGRPDDRSIGVAQRGLKAIEKSLSGSPALKHPITGARHVIDAWEDQLWGVMHNGSKHFYFDVTWRREVQRLEDSKVYGEKFLREQFEALKTGRKVDPSVPVVAEDMELGVHQFVQATRQRMKQGIAREIVQTSNNAFGGQAMSALMENPEWQRNLRRVLLAPDWTLSQLAMTGSMFMNMTKAQQVALGSVIGTGVEMAEMGFDPEESGLPWRGMAWGAAAGGILGKWTAGINRRLMTKGDLMAKEARRMTAAALVGGFTFVNLLNRAFTGRWAWENEEGQKISIEMPGMTESGRKRYVKLGKPWLEAWEFAGVAHAERYPLPVLGRLRSKMAVIPSGVVSVIDNKTIFGPIFSGDDTPAETAIKAVQFGVDTLSPIVLQGPVRAAASGFEPGESAAGAIRLSGFQVSTGRDRAQLPILGEAIRPPTLSETPFIGGF